MLRPGRNWIFRLLQAALVFTILMAFIFRTFPFYVLLAANVITNFIVYMLMKTKYDVLLSSFSGIGQVLELFEWSIRQKKISLLVNDRMKESVAGLKKIRKKIGVVSQDVMIFEDTIRYNLNLGNGYSDEEIYRAFSAAKPSLIRTEADELTYSYHIMIRYELEKRLFAGEITAKDLPAEWNRMYKEYLGVDVPNNREGVLQDTHWSGGMFGYFPSYALGSAYGAQLLRKMSETVDVYGAVAAGDLAPVRKWLGEHIWQYGSLYTPRVLMEKAFGGEFSASCYVDYLTEKFSDIYAL